MLQLLISFAIFVIGMILIYRSTMTLNTKSLLMLIIAVLFMVILLYYKAKLFYRLQQIQYLKLKHNQASPISTNLPLIHNNWISHIIQKKFISYFDSSSFSLLYRYNKKSNTSISHRNNLLEIIILIKDHNLTYTSHLINQYINKLEDELYTENYKISNYSIFICKSGLNNSPKIIHEADQVTFDKKGRISISVINGFYNLEEKNLYFLYNENYSPTINYKFTVDMIKDLLK